MLFGRTDSTPRPTGFSGRKNSFHQHRTLQHLYRLITSCVTRFPETTACYSNHYEQKVKFSEHSSVWIMEVHLLSTHTNGTARVTETHGTDIYPMICLLTTVHSLLKENPLATQVNILKHKFQFSVKKKKTIERQRARQQPQYKQTYQSSNIYIYCGFEQ